MVITLFENPLTFIGERGGTGHLFLAPKKEWLFEEFRDKEWLAPVIILDTYFGHDQWWLAKDMGELVKRVRRMGPTYGSWIGHPAYVEYRKYNSLWRQQDSAIRVLQRAGVVKTVRVPDGVNVTMTRSGRAWLNRMSWADLAHEAWNVRRLIRKIG